MLSCELQCMKRLGLIILSPLQGEMHSLILVYDPRCWPLKIQLGKSHCIYSEHIHTVGETCNKERYSLTALCSSHIGGFDTSTQLLFEQYPTGCPSHFCHPCCTSTKEYWSSGKIWLWNYIHLYFLTVPTVISPKSNKCHHSSHKPVSSDLRGRGKFNSLWLGIHLSTSYSLIEL